MYLIERGKQEYHPISTAQYQVICYCYLLASSLGKIERMNSSSHPHMQPSTQDATKHLRTPGLDPTDLDGRYHK